MSRSGTITFRIQTERTISIDSFIEKFKENGWTLNVDGTVRYLPIGDDGNYDWQFATVSDEEEIISILMAKQFKKEELGFFLLNKIENVALEIRTDFRINILVFTAYGDRKLILNTNVTDFSWYNERIIPILNSLNVYLEEVECVDSR